MNHTPCIRKEVESCECTDDDLRGQVRPLYELVDQQIRCANCGAIPPELSARSIPKDCRVELDVYHELGRETPRIYRVVFYPTATDLEGAPK